MIELKNINKYYKNNEVFKALDNVNLKFKSNGLTLLSGQSGAGKSTLLNILAGRVLPDSGAINNSFDKDKIGFLSQDFSLIDEYSVYETLYLLLIVKNDNIISINKANEIIDKIGLKLNKDTLVKNLSGGERQRLCLGVLLIGNYDMILLDEPTSALDDTNAKYIANIIKDLSKNKLVIVSSHNIELFRKICDRHIELEKGKVINDNYIADVNSNDSNNLILEQDNISDHKKLVKYTVVKNLFRFKFLNAFTIIFFFLSILSICVGSYFINLIINDNIIETPFACNLNDRTLIYSSNQIDKEVLMDIDPDIELNPLYLTDEKTFIQESSNEEESFYYDSNCKIRNPQYGTLPKNKDEALFIVNPDNTVFQYITENELVSDLLNTKFYYFGNTGETFSISGIAISKGYKNYCLAYNEKIKNALKLDLLDFSIGKKMLNPNISDLNKLVLPYNYDSRQLCSTYLFYYSQKKYSFTYAIDIVYADIKEPELYLSLTDLIIENEVYEAVSYKDSKRIKKACNENNLEYIDIAKYNTFEMGSDDFNNILLKTTVISVVAIIASILFFMMTVILEKFYSNRNKKYMSFGISLEDIRKINYIERFIFTFIPFLIVLILSIFYISFSLLLIEIVLLSIILINFLIRGEKI